MLFRSIVHVGNDFDDNLAGDDRLLRGRPRCELVNGDDLKIIREFPRPRPWYHPNSVYKWLYDLELHRLLRQAAVGSGLIHKEPWELRYCRRQLDPGQKAVEAMAQLLAEFDRRCREHDARLVVVVAPSNWQVHPEDRAKLNLRDDLYDYIQPQRLVSDRCSKLDIPALDLLPALQSFAERGERLYFPHDRHWNAAGNRRVAELIGDWIVGGFSGDSHADRASREGSSAPLGTDKHAGHGRD